MPGTKRDIISQLQQEILHLQGFKPVACAAFDMGLGPIENAFPNACFPIAAVHEFISKSGEEVAATAGFVTALLAGLMKGGKACIWISMGGKVFPPALKAFAVEPDQIIFVDLQREKDMLWAMEEALKCKGLAAVVAEIREISFTASRRLQLAVEQSRVTGFLLRYQPRQLSTTACVSRWSIASLPSETKDGMPGLGFPRWKIDLQKIRNGKPGIWQMEWTGSRLQTVYQATVPVLLQEDRRKTG